MKMIHTILAFWNLLRFSLHPNIWSVSENVKLCLKRRSIPYLTLFSYLLPSDGTENEDVLFELSEILSQLDLLIPVYSHSPQELLLYSFLLMFQPIFAFSVLQLCYHTYRPAQWLHFHGGLQLLSMWKNSIVPVYPISLCYLYCTT